MRARGREAMEANGADAQGWLVEAGPAGLYDRDDYDFGREGCGIDSYGEGEGG